MKDNGTRSTNIATAYAMNFVRVASAQASWFIDRESQKQLRIRFGPQNGSFTVCIKLMVGAIIAVTQANPIRRLILWLVIKTGYLSG